MKLGARAAATVLNTLIQEDRTEVRTYRTRVQNLSFSLVTASFVITAFMLGHVPALDATRLRNTTSLVDLGLATILLISFWRMKVDLVALRKALRGRQSLLNGLREGSDQDIDPFTPGTTADITDSDLNWVVALAVLVILIKMAVVLFGAQAFVAAR